MVPTSVTSARAAASYKQHRGYVLAVLARRCPWLERDEREEALHEAFAVVLEKERAGRLRLGEMSSVQLRAFLTQTAIHKGLDEGKRAGRKRSVPMGDTELTAADAGRAPEEVVAAALEGARVREIVAELSPRRQAIIKLRFFFDRTPQEIQNQLGLTERSYRRELERAQRHIFERYETVRRGTFCESRRSTIMASVLGIAGPGRMREAREHLASCPSCAAWAAELREARRQAAAVLPMPIVAASHGPLERVADTVAIVRDGLANVGASAKHQAYGLVARMDQSAIGGVAGARPGAVAMAVASCITLSGGVTYCAVHGVPGPLRGLSAAVEERPAARKPAARPAPRVAQPLPRASATPRPTVHSAAPSKAAPRPRASASPTSPARQEFGFEQAAPAVTPTPRPVTPPGEFDP